MRVALAQAHWITVVNVTCLQGSRRQCVHSGLALTGTLLDVEDVFPSVFSVRALLSKSMQLSQNEEKVVLRPEDYDHSCCTYSFQQTRLAVCARATSLNGNRRSICIIFTTSAYTRNCGTYPRRRVRGSQPMDFHVLHWAVCRE